jgi:hydroxymethylpyrimidine pyrophosphatase-like HAD family hydrolase
MKELLPQNVELSLDQTLQILEQRIVKAGKHVIVASDIDDTLTNTHVFDEKKGIHMPQFHPDLIKTAKRLPIPLILATGRPMHDPAVLLSWEQLSGKLTPIVVENGGIILHPPWSTFLQMVVEDAGMLFQINPKAGDLTVLKQIQKLFPDCIESLRMSGIITDHHEVTLDTNRKTSIEVRIQDITTKTGTPETHKLVASFLGPLLAEHSLVAVTSGSSVSIHAPNIRKGDAVRHILFDFSPFEEHPWNHSDVFIVTLGDNENDTSLFEIADLGIGVSSHTQGLSDITCPGGEKTALAVLQKIVEVSL